MNEKPTDAAEASAKTDCSSLGQASDWMKCDACKGTGIRPDPLVLPLRILVRCSECFGYGELRSETNA